MAEADLLERRQLVEAGGDDREARHDRTLSPPREEGRVDPVDCPVDAVGREAVRGPRGQVAHDEDPRRTLSRNPRVKQDERRCRGQHHRRHHRHPDAEEEAEPAEVGSRARVHPTHALDGHDPGRERCPEEPGGGQQLAPGGDHACQANSRKWPFLPVLSNESP